MLYTRMTFSLPIEHRQRTDQQGHHDCHPNLTERMTFPCLKFDENGVHVHADPTTIAHGRGLEAHGYGELVVPFHPTCSVSSYPNH